MQDSTAKSCEAENYEAGLGDREKIHIVAQSGVLCWVAVLHSRGPPRTAITNGQHCLHDYVHTLPHAFDFACMGLRNSVSNFSDCRPQSYDMSPHSRGFRIQHTNKSWHILQAVPSLLTHPLCC
jgi:hypothetical protein